MGTISAQGVGFFVFMASLMAACSGGPMVILPLPSVVRGGERSAADREI